MSVDAVQPSPHDGAPPCANPHAPNPRDRSGAATGIPSSSFAASLRGLLGGASSRLLGGLLGSSATGRSGAAATEEGAGDAWFTSLDDFRPLCHMLHRGAVMTAWFAQAVATGHHFVLKEYDKREHMPWPGLVPRRWIGSSGLRCVFDALPRGRSPASLPRSDHRRPLRTNRADKMTPAQERGVRRALGFAETLDHPSLVRCMGSWEDEDHVFVGKRGQLHSGPLPWAWLQDPWWFGLVPKWAWHLHWPKASTHLNPGS